MTHGAHRSSGLRLVLAVLLLVVPLLEAAQAGATVAAIADSVTLEEPPCHAHGMPAGDDGRQGCPHCDGGAPVSQCHCGTHASPGFVLGASAPQGTVPDAVVSTAPAHREAAPPAPTERLYRPPIA